MLYTIFPMAPPAGACLPSRKGWEPSCRKQLLSALHPREAGDQHLEIRRRVHGEERDCEVIGRMVTNTSL
ncbi:MAG TPA: hypothetical protein DCQ17_05325 [Firmicutes bacterium]|nr:hypothetical protein [Bacillota bacterium]HAN94974.1 hypothetical protein [Bacillota bacterium]